MLQLPRLIKVRLVPQPTELFVGDLLVSVHLFHRGQYYYGDTAGLTDRDGVAYLTGEQLLADFREDRELFPMDYKVALKDCDPVIAVIVRGGSEFSQSRESALSNPLVDAAVRRQYELARNSIVRSAECRVPVGHVREDSLAVDIFVKPVGP